MFTLARARRFGGKAGAPIPSVYRVLSENTVHFRRGQLTLVVAAPGVGKSVFSLNLVLRAGVPALYFSCDTDAFTTYVRAGAMLTGWLATDVEQQIKEGHTEYLEAELEAFESVRFDFAGSIGFDDIDEETQAFAATYGQWPHVIVVDNISNVYVEDADVTPLDAACDYLHQLARQTGAAVIALHHATGEYDDGTKPIPQSGLKGKISKVPAMILTLYRTSLGQLGVCPVKNRTGKNDASASWVLPLEYEPARMIVRG